MDYGPTLRRARTLAGHTQESLAKAVRERFPHAETDRFTVMRLEKQKRKRPLDLTWGMLRAVLGQLPDLPVQ